MDAIIEALVCIKETIMCVARAFAQFVMDVVLWGPRTLYAEFMDYLSTFIVGFGFGERVSDLMSMLQSLETHFGYFYDLFLCQQGITLCFSAVIVRFLIKRLPVIG
jgi:hypothetical protein